MASASEMVAQAIIEGQAKLVGGVAYAIANRVNGVTVDQGGVPTLSGDDIDAIDRLVKEYSSLTGPLGVRLCHEAAAPVLKAHPELQIPAFAAF
jgi:hypothetical protein